jgi:hypothetical protein
MKNDCYYTFSSVIRLSLPYTSGGVEIPSISLMPLVGLPTHNIVVLLCPLSLLIGVCHMGPLPDSPGRHSDTKIVE